MQDATHGNSISHDSWFYRAMPNTRKVEETRKCLDTWAMLKTIQNLKLLRSMLKIIYSNKRAIPGLTGSNVVLSQLLNKMEIEMLNQNGSGIQGLIS